MKKIIWTALLALLLGACTQNNPTDRFTIKGHLDQLPEGMVKLSSIVDGNPVVIDSVQSKNGEFEFSGKVQSPELYLISFDNQRGRIRVFVVPGEIKISGTLDNYTIEGSEPEALLETFDNSLEKFDNERRTIYGDYKAAQQAGDKEKMKKIEDRFDEIEEEEKSYIIDFAKTNNTSVVAPYVTLRYIYYFDLDDLNEIAGSLSASLDSSEYVTSLEKQIEKMDNVQIGKQAPVFVQNDTAGKPVSIEDFRGKYLLIDFWASWCSPCRAESPNLVAAYHKYKDKGFTILGVSLDRDKQRWLQAIADDKLNWTQVSDLKFWDNEASNLYAVSSIPSNFLLDPKGIIIAKDLRGDDLNDKLKEIFKE